MFPLAGDQFPKSCDELTVAIRDALNKVFVLPNPQSAVRVEGGQWPSIDSLIVDLSGASMRSAQPPPRPQPTGERNPGITVGRAQVLGHPIRYQQSKLDLELNATALRLDFARDKTGEPLLILADAGDGQVRLRIEKEDLRAMLLAAAIVAAKQHGATIQDLQINLASEGGKSVVGEVRVKAKKIVSGTVILRGSVTLLDTLVAKPSNLSCTGEGMLGAMAAAMINPKLKAAEGRTIPLTALSLGDVKLRDLTIDASDAIELVAQFGR
jgi:hypothetical protein